VSLENLGVEGWFRRRRGLTGGQKHQTARLSDEQPFKGSAVQFRFVNGIRIREIILQERDGSL